MDRFVLLQSSVSELLSIELVAGFTVALSSMLVAYYARQLHKDWSGRADKLDELYKAFFGIDDVATMEGVVDIVESHDKELETHHQRMEKIEKKIEEGKKRRERLDERIIKLKERVQDREE